VVLLAVADNGAAYGFAELSVTSTPVNGSPARSSAAVTGWYVQQAFRSRDIGRLLLESARAWTTAHRLGDLTNPFASQAAAATENTRLPEISSPIATAGS
jgi:GNAT superfamily N-acetyltransferase